MDLQNWTYDFARITRGKTTLAEISTENLNENGAKIKKVIAVECEHQQSNIRYGIVHGGCGQQGVKSGIATA